MLAFDNSKKNRQTINMQLLKIKKYRKARGTVVQILIHEFTMVL